MASHVSSTTTIPPTGAVPRHVAIILDGNGRWATKRLLPRIAGHARGVETVRKTVESCARLGVENLTLFAFSSENWRRPAEEVSVLMKLFLNALSREVDKLNSNNIRLRVIGELSAFDSVLQKLIVSGQERTAGNTGMTLTIAVNYGGRWDVMQAIRAMIGARPDLAAAPKTIEEADFAPYLTMGDAPEPDLFIRTGGEQRISNFLLWHLAYTELYFTETYWPDFDQAELEAAFESYRRRERRFGRTSAQLAAN
ncbi:MAG: di-trans,poly-cis-decaprenylcistransferase [Burkholderiaceae bacterium]|nr:di-trans,poly-cis-decaprenylcistransferase [Burkholderiaceae bacterium]